MIKKVPDKHIDKIPGNKIQKKIALCGTADLLRRIIAKRLKNIN